MPAVCVQADLECQALSWPSRISASITSGNPSTVRGHWIGYWQVIKSGTTFIRTDLATFIPLSHLYFLESQVID